MLGDVQILKSLSDLPVNPIGPAVDFFAAAVETPKMATRLTLQLALSAPSRVAYRVVNGANVSIWLNGGTAIPAGTAFAFTIATRPGQTYNFTLDAGATITDLELDAVFGGS